MIEEGKYVLDIETTGLDPWRGDRITMIGVKPVGEEPIIFYDEDESIILKKFWDWIMKITEKGLSEECPTIITKNGDGFDFPFLKVRTLIHDRVIGDLRIRSALIDHIMEMQSHIDLQIELGQVEGQKTPSLNDMAKALGIPEKLGSGKDSPKLFWQGKIDKLQEYLKRDLEVTEQIYIRARPLLMRW
ncbi:hypothetical protein GF312_13775 [Candidatus Poribacteria bacterium]|nr:hypothetical protein [Candidatus Poribacteria bacterium]